MSDLYSRSIYCGPNPYGYRLNINHPKIKELSDRYRRAHGLSMIWPMSDAQRLDFENIVIERIEKNEHDKIQKSKSDH